MSSQDPQLEMPGFDLPLNEPPRDCVLHLGIRGFPNALDQEHIDYGCFDNLVTFREILMMRVMNVITDKPEWNQKVFDQNITSRWREEVAQSGQDVTQRMMDYIIKELQWKAETLNETGLVEVFNAGVLKSDRAISQQLQQDLKQAAAGLEKGLDNERDFHPGSDGKVVNLVHPSLFPLIFGQTRVLSDKVLSLDDCLNSTGEEEIVPVPSEEEFAGTGLSASWPSGITLMSPKFQWLPCDVELTKDSRCHIVSYINNAHPVRHRRLYEVVERVLECVIPLWNESLSHRYAGERRIECTGLQYGENVGPRPIWPGDLYQNDVKQENGLQKGNSNAGVSGEDGDTEEDLDEDSDRDKLEDEELDEESCYQRWDEWEKSRPIIQPEPSEFRPVEILPGDRIDLQENFPDTKLQVVVKLANIELTPEKPEYEGGSWHLEGSLNERICATAIYYYDSENITENTLGFRQRGTGDFLDLGYEQDSHGFLQEVYGFGPEVQGRSDTQVTQDLGSVVCREGRLLTFPNTIQHCVSPFSLEDTSKPGHRKIRAVFLIDPHRRIISSANVPPQRIDWASESRTLGQKIVSERLPVELQSWVDDLLGPLMTMEEAKTVRLAFMEERGLASEKSNSNFAIADFNLCEH